MAKSRFGDRLRELREAANLTQQSLGEKAGLTRDGVAQLENGRRKPSWETVLALSEALGISCEAFAQEPSQPAQEPRKGRPPKKSAGGDDQGESEDGEGGTGA